MPTSPLALDRRALLKRISLFAELSDRDLELLAEYTTTRRLKAREVLFRRGDPGGECYVILSGRCKATSNARSGKEMTFAIMDPGEVFGEVALLADHERTATVKALEPCDLLVLNGRDLMPLFQREPQISVQVMRAQARRLSRLSQLFEDILFRSVPSRLARKLLMLADTYGEEHDGAVRIELKLSQGELANLVGSSRETVNRQIAEWAKDDVVTHEDGVLTIRSRAPLEDLADRLQF